MNNILAGLQIIAKYDEDFEISCADHDIIHANVRSGDQVLSDEDFSKMYDLDWMWDDEFPCWSHFT